MTTQPLIYPERVRFWEYYTSEEHDGFLRNAYRSAIAAGFTEHSARNITRKEWFKKGYKQFAVLQESEERRVIDEFAKRNERYRCDTRAQYRTQWSMR